jgi:hypothetical protein
MDGTLHPPGPLFAPVQQSGVQNPQSIWQVPQFSLLSQTPLPHFGQLSPQLSFAMKAQIESHSPSQHDGTASSEVSHTHCETSGFSQPGVPFALQQFPLQGPPQS